MPAAACHHLKADWRVSTTYRRSDRFRRVGSPESRPEGFGQESGPTVAAQLRTFAMLFRSGLEALCVTGYAANVAAGTGHMNFGLKVFTSPFNTTPL